MEPIQIIEKGGLFYFHQGDVEFEIYKESVTRTVGQLDRMNHQVWQQLATVNGLPVYPFDETRLKPLLMRIVQLAWVERWDSGAAYLQKMKDRQTAAIEQYNAWIIQAKEEETKPKATKEGKVRQGSRQYALAPDLDPTKYKGQFRLIVNAMAELGHATAAEIAQKISPQLQTKQPAERVVGYYMNQGQKNGTIVEANGNEPPTAIPSAPAEEKTEPAPTTEPASETPAAPAAKGKKAKKEKAKK